MLEKKGKRYPGIRDRDRLQGVATARTKAETQCVAERTYRGCHPIHSQSYPECHGTMIRTKRRYNDPQSALANRKTTRTPNNFTGGTNPRSQDRLHVSLSRLGGRFSQVSSLRAVGPPEVGVGWGPIGSKSDRSVRNRADIGWAVRMQQWRTEPCVPNVAGQVRG